MVIKCPDVPFLPKENFKALISRDSFIVEEMQVFTAVQKWMECNRVSREEAADLLECVRLTEISQSELKARVMPSGLFDQAQVLEAMGVREAVDRECMSPRGKTGEDRGGTGSMHTYMYVEKMYMYMYIHVAKGLYTLMYMYMRDCTLL